MRWVALPAAGDVPQARSSHTLTAIGSTLYLTGGEHAPRVPLGSDVYAYSLSDKAWRRLATTGTPPPLRNAHAAAAIGSDLYVFGGRCGIDIGEAALNDLWRLDTATATWHAVRLADGSPAPPPRSYAAATATAGKLYLFGGCGAGSTGRLNDLWEFDPTASAWRQLPSSDAIPGRGGPGFVAAEGALFVIAGFAGRETNDVHRFHLATEAWDCPNCFSCTGAAADAQQVPPEQQPACGHAAPVGLPPRSVCAVVAHGCGGCAHKGHVVVFGGEVDPSTEGHAGAGGYSNETYCLDTACGHWHRLHTAGEPPCPRGWLAAAATPTSLVVHGGNRVTNERLGDLFLLEMHG